MRLLNFLGDRGSTARLLAASTVWSIVLRLVGAAFTFVLGVQLARYLQPAGLGIYGVVLGIVTLLGSLAQLGLPMLATRELSETRAVGDWARLRGAIWWFAVANLVAGTILGGAFLLVTLLLPSVSETFITAAYWGAPFIPVLALSFLLNAEVRTFDRLVAGQALEVLVRPGIMSALLLVLLLTSHGLSPATAMAANFLSTVGAVFLGLHWVRQALPPGARSAKPARHLRYWFLTGAPLALTELLRQLDGTYAVLIMGTVTTAAETGIFRVAASSLAVVVMPLSVLHVVLAPTLARLRFEGKQATLQRLLSVAAALSFGAGVMATAITGLCGQWLIVTLFGAAYAGAWLPLLVLVIAHTAGAFFGVGFMLLGVGGAQGDLARCYAVAVTSSIAAAIPLAILWGAVGISVAALIGMLINHGLAAFYLRRRMGLDPTFLPLFIRR